MNITIQQITALATIPEDLHDAFLRVAKGLTERAEYPAEKVLGLFAQMLENPKKFAYSKNKVTNLAQKMYELQKQGIEVNLTDEGRAYIPKGLASRI